MDFGLTDLGGVCGVFSAALVEPYHGGASHDALINGSASQQCPAVSQYPLRSFAE